MRGAVHIGARCALIVALALPCGEAAAQGIFDFLFGRPPERSAPPPQQVQPSPYPSGPSPRVSPNLGGGGNVDQVIGNSSTGRGGTYCVRMCDGRYFPIERYANASPTQLCSQFCPGTPTKVY